MISVFAQPSATFVEGRLSVQSGEDSIGSASRRLATRFHETRERYGTGMKRHMRHAFSFPVS